MVKLSQNALAHDLLPIWLDSQYIMNYYLRGGDEPAGAGSSAQIRGKVVQEELVLCSVEPQARSSQGGVLLFNLHRQD
jgi:hypothetical protein